MFDEAGTKVAFLSAATDLVTGVSDSNNQPDVFVRDLSTGSTTLVSVTAGGTTSGNAGPAAPVISPDGTKVAFASYSSDIGPFESNNGNIFLRDLMAQTTSLLTVNLSGDGGGNASSSGPVFSPDGSKIAFDSSASDLTPEADLSATSDVFIRDLVAGTTRLVSVDGSGSTQSNSTSRDPVFNADGTLVAFTSGANNLGPTDTNFCPNDPGTRGPCQDVYVADVTSGTIRLVSATADGSDGGNDASFDPVFKPDSELIAFTSAAENLGVTDTNANANANTHAEPDARSHTEPHANTDSRAVADVPGRALICWSDTNNP